MITSRKYGFLQVYILPLCPPSTYELVVDYLQNETGLEMDIEVNEYDRKEIEISYRQHTIVLQYDLALGLSVYPITLEQASLDQEDATLALATLIKNYTDAL